MDFNALLNTIITLFLLMTVGFVANKLGIVDAVASKKLSKLIISICQPCLIISSLINVEYSADNLKLGFTTLAFGIVAHIVMSIIAFVACRPFKNIDEQKLSEFSMVFGNCGFIGFPILESLFGAKGLFMGAFFIISFHLLLWTWGIAILARKRNDIKLTVKKIFLNYGTVPSAIGLFFFVLNLDIPVFVTSTVTYLGNLCTPVSMLIIGALLARSELKKLVTTAKLYYLSAMKLIVIPLIVCIITKLVGLSSEWVLFLAAVCCMPSATTVTMLAELHDISPEYSAQGVGLTSLLSVATMPLIIKLAEMIVSLW